MMRDPDFNVERTPPQNIELEMCVLGGIMLEPKHAYTIAADYLSPESFYLDGHKIIFELMGELSARGTPPDSDIVLDELRARGLLEQTGGAAVILSMLNSVPSAASVEYHAKKLSAKANMRALIRGCTQVIEECYRQEMSEDQVLAQAEQMVMGISQGMGQSDVLQIGQVAAEYWAKFSKRYEVWKEAQASGKEVHLGRGIPAGFVDLDKVTGGMRESELNIIAARPSMGKTSLAINMAHKVAVKAEIPVLFFSLEMSNEQLTEKLLSLGSKYWMKNQIHGVRNTDLERGSLETDAELNVITQSYNDLLQAPIFMCDDASLTIQQIKSIARQHKARNDIQLIIIDYLQLITAGGFKSGDNRVQEVSFISRELKTLAKALHVPVIALSQLSRKVEDRTDKRPQLSDLRESGSIEQDADVVMFLYRPSYYDPPGDKHCQHLPCDGVVESGRCLKCKSLEYDTVEVAIRKNRNGPTDTVYMTWTPGLGMFESAEMREMYEKRKMQLVRTSKE